MQYTVNKEIRYNNRYIIDVYSHYFVVYPPAIYSEGGSIPNFYMHSGVIKEFLKTTHHWSFIKVRNQVKREIKASFYSTVLNASEYRLCILQLEPFLDHLRINHIKNDNIEINYHNPDDLDWPIIDNKLRHDKFTLKPVQEEAIKYCLDISNGRTKLIELITGEGKSLVSMGVVEKLKSRLVMVVRSQYIDKWAIDIQNAMEIDQKEIYIARGSEALKDLFQLALEDKLDSIKAILIPNRTMQNYITHYENLGYEFTYADYKVLPEDYCQVLGARVLLIDEGHQDFHFNYKLMLYTHCHVSVTSTATLLPDDSFIRRMAALQYPPYNRFNPGTKSNHIDCIPYFYSFKTPKYIRFKNAQGYSHVLFEQSIMRHVPTENSYFAMIYDILKTHYLDIRKEGHKAIVFCSTIKMCAHLTDYLKRLIPNVDIRKYTGEDSYDNLMNAEISVTTPSSAGTAVDIPGLALGIQTVAVSSSQLSTQIIGRLRVMKDGTNPIFVYMNCLDMESHLRYHREKKSLFSNKIRSFSPVTYNRQI